MSFGSSAETVVWGNCACLLKAKMAASSPRPGTLGQACFGPNRAPFIIMRFFYFCVVVALIRQRLNDSAQKGFSQPRIQHNVRGITSVKHRSSSIELGKPADDQKAQHTL